MYIDPNTGGLLFQVLAVVFGAISGIVLVFSSQIKAGIRRFQRFMRERRGETIEPEKVENQTN